MADGRAGWGRRRAARNREREGEQEEDPTHRSRRYTKVGPLQLLGYATNKDAAHLPAWCAFNRCVGTDGSVGIWNETYTASAGTYENVYVNMPAFGLGRVGTLVQVSGGRHSAGGRLRAYEHEQGR